MDVKALLHNKWTYIIGGGALLLLFLSNRSSSSEGVSSADIPIYDDPTAGIGSGGGSVGSSGDGQSGNWVSQDDLGGIVDAIIGGQNQNQSDLLGLIGGLNQDIADLQSSNIAPAEATATTTTTTSSSSTGGVTTYTQLAYSGGGSSGSPIEIVSTPQQNYTNTSSVTKVNAAGNVVNGGVTSNVGSYNNASQVVYLDNKKQEAAATGNKGLSTWTNAATYAETKLAEAKASGNKGLATWAQSQLNKLYTPAPAPKKKAK